MDLAYLALLLVVLTGYVAYSVWARLDPRYLLGAALLTLLASAAVQALGDTAVANDLAVDTFFVFLAGLALVLLDRAISGRRGIRGSTGPVRPAEPAGQPADAR